MAKAEATVEELVGMIERGELRLPEMQRRYVWRATRVRDLLDSLCRGYPSGAILLWETDEAVPVPRQNRVTWRRACARRLGWVLRDPRRAMRRVSRQSVAVTANGGAASSGAPARAEVPRAHARVHLWVGVQAARRS